MKKSRITKITVFFLLVFIILVGATVLTARPDWRYEISEAIRKPDNDLLPKQLSANQIVTKEYTYEEIRSDKRFVFEDSLMLINEEYTLPADYVPRLINYGETKHRMNVAMIDGFKALASATEKNTGQILQIVSGYRNAEEQLQTIEEEGENAAAVNASEHLTGLALDVCVQYFGGEAFLKSEAGRFVNSQCGEYGLIIRYPMLSESITGIGYEPWHIRYVGYPHSKIMQGAKLTLEEYIDYFEKGEFYRFGDYIITRQPKIEIKLPENFESATVSEDNTGCCIITMS